MEAYRIERFGSVDGIVLRSSEDPRPGLKEVFMRVRASSLNYRDLMVLKGGGRGPTKIGVVPLSWLICRQESCVVPLRSPLQARERRSHKGKMRWNARKHFLRLGAGDTAARRGLLPAAGSSSAAG